jgi:cysteinyl-tRNA synthetase
MEQPHPIRLYNSLTRRVDELRPITPGMVTIYTCGSTVYRYAHIGNLRTYLFGDLLRRTLRYASYEVRYVKNITDVGHMRETGEDPILTAAEHEGKTPQQIAQFYTDAWLEDERLLNIEPPDVMPRATDHIGEMIEMIETLIQKGLAYEVGGNVYFDVSADPGYGALSGQKVEHTLAGTRVERELDKRDPADFALWKRAEPDRLMTYPSPWGVGFPGWHIECSAMSMKYLGERFDIHTGGIDLKFPHHEDEIAQSEGATGHPVVSVWLHGEFLTLDDAKMAKSAGNIIRVSELASKGFDPLDFRYLALTAHYRSKLDFTQAAMQAAASGLRRLRRAVAAGTEADEAVDLSAEPMAAYRSRFSDGIADDLGLPAALAVAHGVASADDLSPSQKRALLLDFDQVLGLDLDAPTEPEPTELPEGAAELLERRAAARAARDWAASDRLREELLALGVTVQDTPEGQAARVGPHGTGSAGFSSPASKAAEEP